MKLSEVKKNKVYLIEAVDESNEIFRSRAVQLGLQVGQAIVLKHCAPFFKDPMLFQVENSLIALTKSEASCIEAKEVK